MPLVFSNALNVPNLRHTWCKVLEIEALKLINAVSAIALNSRRSNIFSNFRSKLFKASEVNFTWRRKADIMLILFWNRGNFDNEGL